ncbi:MAG: FtsW/RodA/SpoVE family cell cycle protein [Chloroflexi bacterium]|nr:FtsW/RodA/SpoVE family cell cycle protein [Chloroflexota bacterium]
MLVLALLRRFPWVAASALVPLAAALAFATATRGPWWLLALWLAGSLLWPPGAGYRTHLAREAILASVGMGLLLLYGYAPAYAWRQAAIWLWASALAGLAATEPIHAWLQRPNLARLGMAIALALTLLAWQKGVSPSPGGPRLWLCTPTVCLHPGTGVLLAWVWVWAYEPKPWARGLWGLAAVAVLLMQGDWGIAGLVVLIGLSGLWVEGRLTARGLARVTVVLLAAAMLAWAGSARVRWRVAAWLWPERDPAGWGYQSLQARCALSQGGWRGAGLAARAAARVPLALTDFAYIAWSADAGLVAALALLLGQSVPWLGLGLQGLADGDPVAARFRWAVAAWLAWQSTWVLGGNVGLLPITGLPLPWVAYGGAMLTALSIAAAHALAHPWTPTRRPNPWRTRGLLLLGLWAALTLAAGLRTAYLMAQAKPPHC